MVVPELLPKAEQPDAVGIRLRDLPRHSLAQRADRDVRVHLNRDLIVLARSGHGVHQYHLHLHREARVRSAVG